MPRGVKKENLPSKICVTCERPFNWRKKWERCWDEVTTCSHRCNLQRKQLKQACNDQVDDVDKHDENDICASDAAADGNDGLVCANDAVADGNDGAVDAPRDDDVVGSNIDSNDEEVSGTQNKENDIAANVDDKRLQRKAACKEAKRVRRAIREGKAADEVGRKICDLCSREVDLLVRCQTDDTNLWRMVCGKCWKTDEVSGGVVDGTADTPHYRYGGLWKNLKKMPK